MDCWPLIAPKTKTKSVMFIPDEFIADISVIDDLLNDKNQQTFYVRMFDAVLMRKADSWNTFPAQNGNLEGYSYRLFIRKGATAAREQIAGHTVQMRRISNQRLSISLRQKDLPLILVEESQLYGQDDQLIEIDELKIGPFTTQNEFKGRHRRSSV